MRSIRCNALNNDQDPFSSSYAWSSHSLLSGKSEIVSTYSVSCCNCTACRPLYTSFRNLSWLSFHCLCLQCYFQRATPKLIGRVRHNQCAKSNREFTGNCYDCLLFAACTRINVLELMQKGRVFLIGGPGAFNQPRSHRTISLSGNSPSSNSL